MLYSSLATGEHTSIDVAVITEEPTGHEENSVMHIDAHNVAMKNTQLHT